MLTIILIEVNEINKFNTGSLHSVCNSHTQIKKCYPGRELYGVRL